MKCVLWLALISAVLALPLRAEVQATPLAVPAHVELATFDPARLGALVVAETNRVRKENHRPVLRERRQLRAAAGEQADFMALTLRSTHANELNRAHDPGQRVQRAGLEPGFVAENTQMFPLVALTYEQAAVQLVQTWIDSPGHRENLLSREADYLGCAVRVARLATGEEAMFAVQVFFRPDDPAEAPTASAFNAQR